MARDGRRWLLLAPTDPTRDSQPAAPRADGPLSSHFHSEMSFQRDRLGVTVDDNCANWHTPREPPSSSGSAAIPNGWSRQNRSAPVPASGPQELRRASHHTMQLASRPMQPCCTSRTTCCTLPQPG